MAYELPSWLQADAPSEPFKALLAGAQVGNQIAQTVNQARAQSDALAQRKYEFDKMQEVQEGIRKYQLQEAELHIEKMKLAKDYEFQTNRAAIEIGNLVNTTDPSSPDFTQKLYGIGARYPAVMRDEVYQHAAELPKQASQLRLQAAQAYHQMNPAQANAADEAAIQNQLAREEQVSITASGQPWTPEQRAKRAAELGQLKDFKPGFKGGIAFDDQGRIQQVTFGDQPTVATASLAQKRILNAREYTSQIDDTLAGMTGDAVGIKGKINEWKNRTLGQINPEWINLPVAEQRVRIANLNETHLAQYERLGRMSQLDRERVREIGPTEGWFDTPERGIRALDTMRSIAKKNAAIDAKSAGTPIEDWMLQGLKPKDLTDLNQRGVLTKDEAIAAYRKLFPAAQ